MSDRPWKDERGPWLGDQRLRVELVFDGADARVDALSVVEGPVVQRPSLTGSLVAVVSVDEEVRVLQAFENPRLVRAIAPPEQIGHHYGLRDEGRLTVDVPLSRDQPAHRFEIRLLDLSDLGDRPVELDELANLVLARSADLRVIAEIETADVVGHPDWQEVKKTAAVVPAAEGRQAARAVRDSGFSDDDQDDAAGYTFEWWLHLPTKVVIAVRLDSADRVAGAARPLSDSELHGPAKGFSWNEEPRFTAAVERHRHQFRRGVPRIDFRAKHQRPEIRDDFQALGFR